MTPPHATSRIVSLHVGPVRQLGADGYSAKPWETGFFKEKVEGALWLGVPSDDGTRAGLEGDAQADLAFHGGPEKAVCAYPATHYPSWRSELGFDPFPFGAFGENFTLDGLGEADVCIGDVFSTGEGEGAPLLQISQPRQPCWKLARRWNVKDLALRVQASGRTGWYFRVLREGRVREGDALRLTERPHPEWPITLANEVMHVRKADLEAAALLAACPLLSSHWKATLGKRAQGTPTSTAARLEGRG